MEKEKGFTLLEMVVVMAILAILSTGFVSGIRWQYKQQMVSAAGEIEQLIQVMQQEAALKNCMYVLDKSHREGQDILRVEVDTRTLYEYTLPRTLKVYIGTKDNPIGVEREISFRQDLSPSSSGTITLRHAKYPYQLQMTVRPVTGIVTLYPLQRY
ncbi:MAG: type II secretion system protein [Niameybacter sp.]|uniref:type II secretion system protein n=1 Tax=Niameybacter sp. TaxID=2033640 RepID=UPI002FC63BAE